MTHRKNLLLCAVAMTVLGFATAGAEPPPRPVFETGVAFAGKSGLVRFSGTQTAEHALVREPAPWPVAAQAGFAALEATVYVVRQTTASLGFYLLIPGDDRMVAQIPLDGLPPRTWTVIRLARDAFTLWPLCGPGVPNWDSVEGLTAFMAIQAGGFADFYVGELKLVTNGGTQVVEPLTANPAPGAAFQVPDGLWTGPFPPQPPPRPLMLYAGSDSRWLLSPEGLKLAAEMKRLFPAATITLAGLNFPAVSAPPYLKKLQEMGVYFQNQTIGYVDVLPLAERPRDWRGQPQAANDNALIATHPGLQTDLKAQVDGAAKLGVNNFKQVDFVWLYQGGRWGYDTYSVAAFRDDLAGRDEGLDLLTAPGRWTTVCFWDFFAAYHGVRFTPADLRLPSWDEYVPETEANAQKGGLVPRRNLEMFLALCSYEHLRQAQRFGRWAKTHGGTYQMTLNPENYGNTLDYVHLIRLRDLGTIFIEYFGSLSNSDGAYYHQPTYRRVADQVGKPVGVISELGMCGHGRPYKDPEMGFIHLYDLTASGFDEYHNEWLSESPCKALIRPAGGPAFSRWAVYVGEAKGYERARLEGVTRPAAPVVSVTRRSVCEYAASWTWGLDSEDSFAKPLAGRLVDFEETDPMHLPLVADRVQTLFYTPPRTTVEETGLLRRWLNGKDHILITHSFIPLSVDSGAAALLGKDPELAVSEPATGTPPRIIHPAFAGLTYAPGRVTGKAVAAVPALKQVIDTMPPLDLNGLWWWQTTDLVPLVTLAGRPLLSEKRLPDGGRILYLHGRLHTLPATVQQALTDAVAVYLRLPVTAIQDDLHPVLLHRYQSATATVAVLYDRKALERLGSEPGYSPQLATTCYAFAAPGTRGGCRLAVNTRRPCRILYFMDGREERVEPDAAGTVELRLHDRLADLCYVAEDSPAWQATIANLKTARQTFLNLLKP